MNNFDFDKLYSLNERKRIGYILEKIGDLINAQKFNEIDQIIKQINFLRITIPVGLALLTVTRAIKNQLEYREKFIVLLLYL